ncbi:MAG: glucose-6-phosphate isomerase [Clostridiaceae bacterium]|jgi:glucose-6-phosphate isomerase|nr:glucose-6-phosphate isomerase [Eubacteriales bacterium]MDD4187044.1 glucose-6-phosphate isomerase [Eubacteriales bacterium]MDY0119576.1 glucose-6-phosphate isomerase [Clostridia bacterium]NLG30193.1 glucose-6-phosphate isomerase [Clostridiaceae bacterium]
MLSFDDHLTDFVIKEHERHQMEPQLRLAREQLDKKTGPGSDFMGWVDLPLKVNRDEIDAIMCQAKRIRDEFDVLIVVGIGGSYLGARAVIESLSSHFSSLLSKDERKAPLVLFAGHQLSAPYLDDLLSLVKGKRVALNVISKSGTTTEPAVAFRVLREHLFAHMSASELARSIFVTTDEKKGALRQLATELGLPSFVVADDIGGRFSVLTAVGLLPIAVQGIDIVSLLEGAKAEYLRATAPLEEGWAASDRYAVNRQLLSKKGYNVEILAQYEPSLFYIGEWWKQLFGESEGKDNKGIIPTATNFTTDLHSLGQLIQDGPRSLFETVLSYDTTGQDLLLPSDPSDLDGLEYLAGRPLSFINEKAREGTALAHAAGGVPLMDIRLKERSPYAIGQLLYFFMRACALSALMSGVNPFDQPGVEAYKQNMFALLGKPGHESI